MDTEGTLETRIRQRAIDSAYGFLSKVLDDDWGVGSIIGNPYHRTDETIGAFIQKRVLIQSALTQLEQVKS